MKGGTALIVAAAAGQTDCIARLVGAGAYVDRENATGKTALMVAVQKGSQEAGAYTRSP
jgi:ankyrin repeat protein